MNDTGEGMILVDAGGDVPFEKSFFERSGHPVVICHGPADESLCPLLAGDGCTKFDDAHGIVFELDLDRAQHRAIVDQYRHLAADMPIKVLVHADQAERYAQLLEAFEVWTKPPTTADLDGFAAEVEAADRFS